MDRISKLVLQVLECDFNSWVGLHLIENQEQVELDICHIENIPLSSGRLGLKLVAADGGLIKVEKQLRVADIPLPHDHPARKLVIIEHFELLRDLLELFGHGQALVLHRRPAGLSHHQNRGVKYSSAVLLLNYLRKSLGKIETYLVVSQHYVHFVHGLVPCLLLERGDHLYLIVVGEFFLVDDSLRQVLRVKIEEQVPLVVVDE